MPAAYPVDGGGVANCFLYADGDRADPQPERRKERVA
jgi:hypothetical protein